ncbi:MAG TPA: hypothetical protein VNC18_13935 [Gemmatimonadaceae bacterium]|jgi:hypothetical protein|nr:hypothetical protein [Gemmatimonadaceae bacterium]
MSQPPRALESILKGLGADPYLSEVILGDLAEEYTERVTFDGRVEARRWYIGEALRSVPHLLRSAMTRLRVGDVPRLIGNSLFAWLTLLPVGLTLYAIVAGVLRVLAIEWPIPPTPQNTGFVALAMVAMPISGLVGGYIAAWRNARAPLIGALAFGVVLTSINLIAGLIVPSPLTFGLRFVALAMFNVAAIVGGVIRATRRPALATSYSRS